MTDFLTHKEIVDEIFNNLNSNEIHNLKNMPKEEMSFFHFSVGMHIRNKYKLWDENNPLTKAWFFDCQNNSNNYLVDGVDYHPNHPDTISSLILEDIWELAQKVEM